MEQTLSNRSGWGRGQGTRIGECDFRDCLVGDRVGKKRDESQIVRPVIRVAPLGELKVYTINEHELETLGQGSPGSVYIGFALALLPWPQVSSLRSWPRRSPRRQVWSFS